MDNLNDESLVRMQVLEDSDTIKKNMEDLISFCAKRDNMIMRRDNIDEYKRKMMNKFYYIHEKYPTLFFTIIENPTTFPISRLEEMLSLKKQIEVNSTTTDKASVQLGQKYFDEFVKDKIKNLDNGEEHKKVENNYFNNLIKDQINSLDDSSKTDNK
jgi:hypothetical protein